MMSESEFVFDGRRYSVDSSGTYEVRVECKSDDTEIVSWVLDLKVDGKPAVDMRRISGKLGSLVSADAGSVVGVCGHVIYRGRPPALVFVRVGAREVL